MPTIDIEGTGSLFKSSAVSWAALLASSAEGDSPGCDIERDLNGGNWYLIRGWLRSPDLSEYAGQSLASATLRIKVDQYTAGSFTVYYQNWTGDVPGESDWVAENTLTPASIPVTAGGGNLVLEIPLINLGSLLTANGRFMLISTGGETEPSGMDSYTTIYAIGDYTSQLDLVFGTKGTPYVPDVAPRTDAEILSLVQSGVLEVSYRAELLNSSDTFLADLTPWLGIDGSVSYKANADINRVAQFSLANAQLDWDTCRVRILQRLSGAGYVKDWPLGIFLPVSQPATEYGEVDIRGESVITYPVTAWDKLWLLSSREVGDSYRVDTGTSAIAALYQLFTDAGITGLSPLIDDTGDATIPAPGLAWGDTTTKWAKVANDILAAIAYPPLWVDGAGRFRAAPYVDPTVASPLLSLDATNVKKQMLSPSRKRSVDKFAEVNWVRFVNNATRPTTPTEGDGYYTIDQSTGEPLPRPHTEYGDWADQNSMEAAADMWMAETRRRPEVLDFELSPYAGWTHKDVLDLADPNMGNKRGVVFDWQLPLDGGNCKVLEDIITVVPVVLS